MKWASKIFLQKFHANQTGKKKVTGTQLQMF